MWAFYTFRSWRGRSRWRGMTVAGSTRIDPSLRTEGSGITVGERTRIRRDVFVRGPEVRIGDGVHVGDGCYINHHVSIDDGVAIGQFVRLITGGHEMGPSDHRAGRTTTEPIIVCRGAWLGASVTVLGGVTIGEGAVVAGGSVVTKDCKPNALYAGVPAEWKKDLPTSYGSMIGQE